MTGDEWIVAGTIAVVGLMLGVFVQMLIHFRQEDKIFLLYLRHPYTRKETH